MKYMLMMHHAGEGCPITEWPAKDVQAHIAFMMGLNEELKKTGELLLAEGLAFPDAAKIVRAKNEKAPVVTDGPFPETKEFLAGFWIVQVPTEARALAIAARASAAPGMGGAPIGIPIEVRQVMVAPDMPA